MDNAATYPVKTGTAGGTLLVVLLQIGTGELLKTAVLAAVGATVSFTISLALKELARRWRKSRQP